MCGGVTGLLQVAKGLCYMPVVMGLPNAGDSGGLQSGVEKVKADCYTSFPLVLWRGVAGDASAE